MWGWSFFLAQGYGYGTQGNSQLYWVSPLLNPSLKRVQKPVFCIFFNGIHFVLHNTIIFCEKHSLKIDFSYTPDPSSLTLYHFHNSLASISQELPPAVIFFSSWPERLNSVGNHKIEILWESMSWMHIRRLWQKSKRGKFLSFLDEGKK